MATGMRTMRYLAWVFAFAICYNGADMLQIRKAVDQGRRDARIAPTIRKLAERLWQAGVKDADKAKEAHVICRGNGDDPDMRRLEVTGPLYRPDLRKVLYVIGETDNGYAKALADDMAGDLEVRR